MVLEAPGWAGWACAPREMLVERMLKNDDGAYVVLFASVDAARACQVKGLMSEGGGAARCGGVGMARHGRTRSLYTRPVLGEVRCCVDVWMCGRASSRGPPFQTNQNHLNHKP
eukprot:318365-Chlamydomonas_euryale.AAC.3